MSKLLSNSCACIIVFSICLATARAYLGNESFPSNSTGGVRSNGIDERWRSLSSSATRDGPGGAIDYDGKRYSLEDGEGEKGKTDEACNDRSINDFPVDAFTYVQRRHGAVLLHAFLAFYCFLLTAFICHDYLLPSLERLCAHMNISTDVAGATFLATASAFPEMFVNLVGTFVTESDLGAGTVVGSAVFDTFATPACGALMALHAIPLEWRILSRDCLMYVVSVGTLVIIMWDQKIQWFEAVVLLLLLAFYLVLLFGGKSFATRCSNLARHKSATTAKLAEAGESRSDVSRASDGDEVHRPGKPTTTDPEEASAESEEKSAARSMSDYLFVWPREKSLAARCWFLLGWPLKLLLFVTVPDVRLDRWKKWYPATFVLCVAWIGIASYLVSWMTTVIGDTVGIPDSIMGLTFLAAGGNIPEMASIVILARQGDGNMAMSNTLGANIFDILLCLGLPWTVKCLMTGSYVKIDSGALSYSVLSLVICIGFLYAVIALFDFKLNRKVGLICLLLYTVFVVFAILVEMNVFFFVNLPMCD